MKLNKRAKKLWIKALRSGQFQQANGAFFSNEQDIPKHCCLAVAEYTCAMDNWKGDKTTAEQLVNKQAITNSSNVSYDCLLWLGLTDIDIKGDDVDDLMDKFVTFNDKKKHSFNWIASYIERYL